MHVQWGGRPRPKRRVARLGVGLLAFVLTLVGLVEVAAPSHALRRPARPAVAGSEAVLAVAAADALAALWARDEAYGDRLTVLVPLVAQAGKITPEQVSKAWASASRERMIALLSALSQVGVPYRARRATAGVGFDCSGLTSWAWAQAGRYLPHQSLRQIRRLRKSSKAEVLPGDILYYPGHAMMAIGVGAVMVHAPYPGRSVEVSPPTGRWERIVRVGTPDGKKAPLPSAISG
jgi:cell wall-associated NlpC family hydrolase